MASHIPYDSLLELVNGLIMFIETNDPRVIRWNTEPIEDEFIFSKIDDKATFKVKKFTDSQTNQF